MKRSKENKKAGTIKYRKQGAGSFRLGRRIIKPGQTFYAHPDEISEAFKDVVVPLEKVQESVIDDAIIVEDKSVYKLSHKSGGWYDIVNAEGKVLNEKSMKKADAEDFIKQLTEA